jgi:archaellum component FlaF (FlaF/FlaG flagellin family)
VRENIMLTRTLLISSFLLSFVVTSYLSNVHNNKNVTLSQSEPEIKYDGKSVRQVRKYKPIKGAEKKKNPKRLAKKNRQNPNSNNPEEVFTDEEGVKIFPDGTNIYKDGTNVWVDGTTVYPDGTTVYLVY